METNDDKTTRFVVIDPTLFKLEGNLYNSRSGSHVPGIANLRLAIPGTWEADTHNGFLATAQAAKRLTGPNEIGRH
jgi:hypothetical protein